MGRYGEESRASGPRIQFQTRIFCLQVFDEIDLNLHVAAYVRHGTSEGKVAWDLLK